MTRTARTDSGLDRLQLLIPLLSLALLGCGGKGVVPVETQILLDGKPLAQASVTLIRTGGEEGRAAVGITEESGIAKLTTFEPFDGALPGSYAVVVIKPPENPHTYQDVDVDNVDSMIEQSSMYAARKQQKRYRVRTVIPKIYGSVQSTPLKCTVAAGSQEFKFDLTSKQ